MKDKVASFQGYDPFAAPALPISLVNALGLHATGQAQPDAHLLAAVAPQANLFFGRKRPDIATHALITALLTEGGDQVEEPGEDGNSQEFAGDDAEEEKDAAIKAASERLGGFMAGLSSEIRQELKKRAQMGAITHQGVGTAEAQLGAKKPDMARRAMGLAKRRGGYVAGTPSKWRTLQDASTLASTDATTDATKSAAINLGGLLGRLRQAAGNTAGTTVGNISTAARDISTAARNVATGVPRAASPVTLGLPPLGGSRPVVRAGSPITQPGARPSPVAAADEFGVPGIPGPSWPRLNDGRPYVPSDIGRTRPSPAVAPAPDIARPVADVSRPPGALARAATSPAALGTGVVAGLAGGGLTAAYSGFRAYDAHAALRDAMQPEQAGVAIGRVGKGVEDPDLLAAHQSDLNVRQLVHDRVKAWRDVRAHGAVRGLPFSSVAPRRVLDLAGDGLSNLLDRAQPIDAMAVDKLIRRRRDAELKKGAALAFRAKSAKSSILLKLLAAKGSSDQKDYAKKHNIMRSLMTERPDEFDREEPVRGIQGITHKPTGFRLHLPKNVVPIGGN